MDTFQKSPKPNTFFICKYGGEEDEEVFEFHMIVTILTIPLAVFLLYSSSLRRFYAPLARIVNISLIMSFVCSFLFFWQWGSIEDDSDDNCAEILLSRINTILVMFGELHQIYVIAYSLGLGAMKIPVFSFVTYSLEQVLNIAVVIVVATILVSFFYFRDVLMTIEDVWTVFISVAQLYVISVARKSKADDDGSASVISPNDSSILVFEKMSVFQLFLASICFSYRMALNCMGTAIFGRLDLTLSLLDEVCTFLFYLKTLLIKERTNLSIDVVQS
mmetsp:Transcript_14189/g.23613  ORF Transcript_14189/g.23613 Transcript_14189/m.23613 type:complete len:275 (+) Transcript_14189:36-860(+)